jgi:hypothetical protein
MRFFSMDRRILPSNGDVLRCLFFLPKLANYRFSEACCELGAELEHIWQQFQLDISTKSSQTKTCRFKFIIPNLFLSWLNIIVNKSRTTKKQHWLPLDF